MPCSQTPAESRHQALAMPILLPSAVPNTSAPLVSVTGLYHTACTPPVYASQAGSLPHRATLGSGGWPVLSGSGLSPAGSQQEVSACLLHVNMLPPLPGFAWRNGTMIKVLGRHRKNVLVKIRTDIAAAQYLAMVLFSDNCQHNSVKTEPPITTAFAKRLIMLRFNIGQHLRKSPPHPIS